jgi:hypothetical protein
MHNLGYVDIELLILMHNNILKAFCNHCAHFNCHDPKLLDRLKCEFKVKIVKGGPPPPPPPPRRGLELRDGTRKNDKHLITRTDLHKTK